MDLEAQKSAIIKTVLSRCVLDDLLLKFDFLTKYSCSQCYKDMFTVSKHGVENEGHDFCLNGGLYRLQYILGLHPEILAYFIDHGRVERKFYEAVARLDVHDVPFYISSSKYLRDCLKDVYFLGEIEEMFRSDLKAQRNNTFQNDESGYCCDL